MKTIITLLLLVLSVPMMAQTNVISLKSHAGDLAHIEQERDNFGEPPWKMNVDTVEFIEKGVIVEYGFLGHRDTLHSDIYDEHITDRLQDYYSPRCVFIGFQESKHKNYQQEKQTKKNGVALIAVCVAFAFMLKFRKFTGLNSTFKSLIVIVSIFLSTSISAQTNVISLKSHAGEMAYLHEENDNFGAIYTPPLRAQVDTVKFIRNGVIVEYRQALHQSQYPITMGKNVKHQEIDTIRNPYYTENLTPVLKRLYPSTTVFIGFKQDRTDAAKPYFDSIHKNGLSIWAILLFGIVGFSFIQVKKLI